MRHVVLFSGGLDSTLCLYMIREEDPDVVALTVDYDQPHFEEVGRAASIARELGVEHRIVTVRSLYDGTTPGFFSESADLSVASETVVPCRNLVLLSLGAVFGDAVVIGANADDQEDYPDCRKEFFESASLAMGVKVLAPLLGMSKREVVEMARKMGVPIDKTLSCYRGTGCGECAACRLRMEAIG